MDGREYMHMIYLTIRLYVPAPMTHWYSKSDPTQRQEKWSMVATLPFLSIFSVKTQ